MKDEELLSKHGDLGTFTIRVQHCRDCCWQGRITWMDRNKSAHFQSVWEMVRLVSEALDTVSEEDGQKAPSWADEAWEE